MTIFARPRDDPEEAPGAITAAWLLAEVPEARLSRITGDVISLSVPTDLNSHVRTRVAGVLRQPRFCSWHLAETFDADVPE